jgi:hypothetical protein
MTTQYKWLPEQPTNEMLDAVFALEEPNTLREYEAMRQAAPKRETCTVTRHEIREAMMYCEINHCDDPDAYTFDILKRLGIGVE